MRFLSPKRLDARFGTLGRGTQHEFILAIQRAIDSHHLVQPIRMAIPPLT
jgi:hypothetical protein